MRTLHVITNFFIVFIITLLIGCGSDDDTGLDQDNPQQSFNTITSFNFLTSNNATLNTNIAGKIDQENKIITVEFDSATDITALKPNIEIATGAIIEPDPQIAQDFTNEITYTVTAENGDQSIYTIQVSTLVKGNEKRMLKFEIVNTFTEVTYNGIIDEEKKEVTLILPENINFNFLEFNITVSQGATSSTTNGGSSVDFSEIVDFTVTAEDGSSAVYAVNVYRENTLRSDRQALIDFYNARSMFNPLALASWSKDDMKDWQGVTIEEGRVTKLLISDPNLFMKVVPASIGKLTKLRSLTLLSISLEEIPNTIGNLTELQILDLSGNSLKELPKEIGNLTKLRTLDLSNNQLKTIPDEIGNLTELSFQLHLSDNNLESIPSSIRNLTKLGFLRLSNNSLKNIPENTLGNLTGLITLDISNNKDLVSIPGDLGKLTGLSNLYLSNTSLTTIPDNFWELIGLRELDLSDNSVTSISTQIEALTELQLLNISDNRLGSIPREIGNLGSLIRLDISKNPLTIIPREVCDLDFILDSSFVKDQDDECEIEP